METLLEIIQRRQEEFFARLPARTFREYRTYLIKKSGGSALSPSRLPFWIHLSKWLTASDILLRKNGFHADALWGQFCIFCSLRILDDVLDSGAKNDLRQLVGQYQSEARRTFRRHFPSDSSFWREFEKHIQTSIRSNDIVGKMQRQGSYSRSDARSFCASSSSIFKIIVAAYHEPCGEPRLYKRLCAAVDHLAVAGQLIDDFIDMMEDLRGGRVNFAARAIVNRALAVGTPDAMMDTLARKILWGSGLVQYSNEISRHITAARHHLHLLGLPDTDTYLSSYDRWLEDLHVQLHQTRMRTLLRYLPLSPVTDTVHPV